jgi:hypothetical protein
MVFRKLTAGAFNAVWALSLVASGVAGVALASPVGSGLIRGVDWLYMRRYETPKFLRQLIVFK